MQELLKLGKKDFPKLLRNRLKTNYFGVEAQKKMMPEGRILKTTEQTNIRKSAVLIAFFKEANEWFFPLIKRASYQGVHSGEMALPGGKFEPSDKTIATTALREAREEIGICAKDVILLGHLTELYIPVSNTNVTPMVGYLKNKPELTANKKEVESIFLIKISDLLNDKNRQTEIWNFAGEKKNIPFYTLENHKVWGATAMILSELKELLMN